MDVIGEVMSVKGNRAVVRTARHATCNRCGACGLFSNTPDMEVEAVNEIGAVPGDRVQLSIESRSVVEAAFLAYMVPLFLFVIGVFGGYQAARMLWPAIHPEWMGIPAGLVLMVAGYAYLRAYDRKATQKGKYLPHITGFDRD